MTNNTNLTELETILLNDVISHSEFKNETLNLNLAWEEQRLEHADMYEALVATANRSQRLGLPINTIKGVMGSLQKKHLINIYREDYAEWLLIREKEFNRIKAALAN